MMFIFFNCVSVYVGGAASEEKGWRGREFGGRKATAESDAENVEGGPANGLLNNTSNPRLKRLGPFVIIFLTIYTYIRTILFKYN